MKPRSYRSVLRTGFQLYNEKFRPFFKASWLTALIIAVLYGTLAALLLITFPATPLALLMLAVMPIALPLVYALIRRLLKRQRDFWLTPLGNFKTRLRHCGIIIGVLLTSILLILLVSIVIQTPAAILCIANLEALQGMLIGDPSGMPSYMTGLTFFTFVLTAFLQFYVSQPLLVHHYYACGSIDAKEAERQRMKLNV